MQRLSCLAVIFAIVASCATKPTGEELAGCWVRHVPGTETRQGMCLNEDGTAFSVNTDTSAYEHWQSKDGFLILSGQHIANGQLRPLADSFGIVKVSNEKLVLRKESLETVYHRSNLSHEGFPTDIVRGTITFSPEVRIFQSQDDTTKYWLIDKSGYLQESYFKSGQPEWKTHAELVIRDLGKIDDGFASAYCSTYQILHIIQPDSTGVTAAED